MQNKQFLDVKMHNIIPIASVMMDL